MSDLVKIQFNCENGEVLSSEVLAESLSVWLDHGWELAPDFLSEEEESAPEFTFEDWVAVGGETVIEESADETEAGELPQDIDENEEN